MFFHFYFSEVYFFTQMIKWWSPDPGRNWDLFLDDLREWQRTEDWSWGLAIQGDHYDQYDQYSGDDVSDDKTGNEASVAVCQN